MPAVLLNTIAIILGSAIGLLFRRGLPKPLTDVIMEALGLCTVVIGIQGVLAETNILIMILSAVIGVFIGEAMDWDGHINRFAERVTGRFSGKGEAASIASAFVTSCLIMNVGAMVIVGSLDAGLRQNYSILYTKSLLDFVSGIMLSAAMGIGVMGSALFTLVFQGGIVLFAEFLAPYATDALVNELSATGSLLILAIGLNMIGVTKFKVLNYVPALLVVPFAMELMALLGL